jgi:hypothetical protein
MERPHAEHVHRGRRDNLGARLCREQLPFLALRDVLRVGTRRFFAQTRRGHSTLPCVEDETLELFAVMFQRLEDLLDARTPFLVVIANDPHAVDLTQITEQCLLGISLMPDIYSLHPPSLRSAE